MLDFRTKIPPHLRNISIPQLSDLEKLQQECDVYNSIKGKLKGYDCPKCNNRGYIQKINREQTATVTAQCSCMKIRKAIQNVNSSGISQRMKSNTFNNFVADKPFQQLMKSRALDFLKDNETCFYVGGQIGCGKTHICTALFKELLISGKSGKYIKWQDYITELKQAINNWDRYSKLINEAKNCEVLYIDDFFKNRNSTESDAIQAFKIIDERYNSGKITIISSERSLEELQQIDEAVSSRIKEMTGDKYLLYIEYAEGRNYRTKKDCPH